jgi:hypothetical protein
MLDHLITLLYGQSWSDVLQRDGCLLQIQFHSDTTADIGMITSACSTDIGMIASAPWTFLMTVP